MPSNARFVGHHKIPNHPRLEWRQSVTGSSQWYLMHYGRIAGLVHLKFDGGYGSILWHDEIDDEDLGKFPTVDEAKAVLLARFVMDVEAAP